MKYIILFSALLVSSLAYADNQYPQRSNVLPQNMSLAKSLATRAREIEIGNQCGSGEIIYGQGEFINDFPKLKGDANKAYRRASTDERYAEVIKVRSLNGMPLIHINATSNGVGCELIFTMRGEFLNQLCGSYTGDWKFKSNP